ncbi:hypothetical protein [Phytoactinopolyspora limicola]|uniref:hypothetical protein n=1 Tax=Phytoactinopolyspora limicola TaxID=2715536 RepID=UPI001407977B|nr:hypothetical protein [Phytoactinopolyspora limicola]
MPLSQGELDELAGRWDTSGPGAVAAELDRLAECAASAGADPLLLVVMCDDHEPAVARERAFARVVAQYTRRCPIMARSQVDHDCAASSGQPVIRQ